MLAVGGIVALGRLVLRPLFRSVARTRSIELFVAACLLVVVASALATAAAGLSMAIGALIGGLLLAVTEFRRQVEMTIDPFKGLLVGVFLISIGLGVDLRLLVAHPLPVLGAAVGLMRGEDAGGGAAGRLFGLPWTDGLQAGLLLGPGGEFGFVIWRWRGGGSAEPRRARLRADRGGADDGGHSAAVAAGRRCWRRGWRARCRRIRRCWCRSRMPRRG